MHASAQKLQALYYWISMLMTACGQPQVSSKQLLWEVFKLEWISNSLAVLASVLRPGGLTPNHLLLLKAKLLLPPGEWNDIYSRRRWHQVQYLADLFWKRWTREYLPSLQERQKWSRPERNISVGDIIPVVDDSAPRNSWIMWPVIQEDSKGWVRQVQVKTSINVLLRPVTKHCLLF